ncbi:MAG: hypothetical protein KTR20_15490 [Cellvibrionaceae bacterium]|nr:hypothetical protein [Cellvibrionaceae bacterium]
MNLGVCVVGIVSFNSYAGPVEQQQAKRIHERLTGVIPTEVVLTQMEQELLGTDTLTNGTTDGFTGGVGAALVAMENEAFYSATLKNWVAPWTNRDQNVFVDLNDYIATVMGLVRDELDFRQVLYGDVLYTSNASGLTAYANDNNAHYEEIEAGGISLKDTLVSQLQSSLTGLPAAATAGVMTSRAAAEAFFIDGTNRAMFRYTLLNHTCRDLEQVQDNTRPPDRIRQDISRSPGGDSRVFLNNCVACHSGMDPMAQAFAYYDFDNDETDEQGNARTPTHAIVYNDVGDLDPVTGTRVNKKYRINATTFPYGYVTPDDRWDNYWREGANSLLGWDSGLPGAGNGAKSLGQELAHSEAFAQCQVEKVFQNICLRDPINAADIAQMTTLTANFQANNYNLKRVFAETADYCK